MPDEQPIGFPPLCLDPSTECVWRGAQRIHLRRKTFAVLHYLVVTSFFPPGFPRG